MITLRLDDSYYLTHSEDVGWDYTTDMHNVVKLAEWQIDSLIKDFEKNGFVVIEGVEFSKMTLLHLELTVKNEIEIHGKPAK